MALHPADNQADACFYSKPPPRVVLSKKLMEDLSASVDQYRSVFERLFPGRSIEQLASLSKDDLIAIIGIPPVTTDQSTRILELGSPISTLGSEGAESLETLIQAPEQDPVADEATRHQSRVQGISDDVNGLSLSLDRPSSYVGVSSITAALKVICRVAPATRRLLALNHTETALPSRTDSPEVASIDPAYLPPAELGQVLIETYFEKVHPLMPMLDEQQFWQTWLYGERKDHAWMALLNTVLALGSVMSSDCTDNSHDVYYQRAMQLLDLDSLGSGNTLVVQALGLLSGYYLHYVSRPNLANNLMGATLRQATVLGLHREYTDTVTTSGTITHKTMSTDVRRRTWWSLYVLDTWANTTTGRPSLRQSDKGITVQVPYNIETTEPTTLDADGEDSKRHEQAEIHEWKDLIEKALRFFERMDRWSVAAKKSHDVVSRLYEASKILASGDFEHSSSAQDQATGVKYPSLNLGTVANSKTGQINPHEDTQLPYSTSDMMTEDIWGLSPNGAAAMNNFWFDDMMWDVPVADIDMFENTGNGLSYSELDWLASLDTQAGSDQTWQFQQ
ncbi:hypothetical protein KCU64_g468, partial [Aureobasidium melanogenum]